MYYLFLALLGLLVFYVVQHVLGSILKGCLISFLVLVIGLLLVLLIKSTGSPNGVLKEYTTKGLTLERFNL